jgi:hypothetical protein
MKKKKKFLLLCLIIALLATGCRHFPTAKMPLPAPDTLPLELQNDFNYPPNNNSINKDLTYKGKFHHLYEYNFISSNDLLNPESKPHTISFDLYQATKPLKNAPTILCLPISGGNYFVSIYFAKFFAKRGYNAIIVKRRRAYKDLITIESINTIIRQMVIDHRQVIDMLQQIPQCDANNIAAIGVSKGGLKTAFISSFDPRIKAAVIALAGGDLPYILANSEESGVVKRRKKYLTKNKIAVEDFFLQLQEKLKYDPIDIARYVNSQNIMIINAYFDNCVPYKCGKLLVEAHKGCEEVVLATGHYTALLTLPYISEVTLGFFKRKLSH